MRRGRTLAACALPALAISVSWLGLESPPQVTGALAMVGLALAPVLAPTGWARIVAGPRVCSVPSGSLSALSHGSSCRIATSASSIRVASAAGAGFGDFYRVLLPLEPEANPEMHGLVLMAIFGFVLAIALLAAASHPLGAAAVTVTGAGWAATLMDGQTVVLGALALAAALSTPLILRVRSVPALVMGLAAAPRRRGSDVGIVGDDDRAQTPRLNWESWDFEKVSAQAESGSPGTRTTTGSAFRPTRPWC